MSVITAKSVVKWPSFYRPGRDSGCTGWPETARSLAAQAFEPCCIREKLVYIMYVIGSSVCPNFQKIQAGVGISAAALPGERKFAPKFSKSEVKISRNESRNRIGNPSASLSNLTSEVKRWPLEKQALAPRKASVQA